MVICDDRGKGKGKNGKSGKTGGCGGRTCTECDDCAHKGQGCVEAREAREKEREVKKGELWGRKQELYLRNRTVVCPGEGCGVHVERDGGCNTMQCEFPSLLNG